MQAITSPKNKEATSLFLVPAVLDGRNAVIYVGDRVVVAAAEYIVIVFLVSVTGALSSPIASANPIAGLKSARRRSSGGVQLDPLLQLFVARSTVAGRRDITSASASPINGWGSRARAKGFLQLLTAATDREAAETTNRRERWDGLDGYGLLHQGCTYAIRVKTARQHHFEPP